MVTNVKQDIPPPDDFKSEEKYVEWVRKIREEDIAFDRLNRNRGQEDSEFAAGYQWAAEDLQRREEQNAPCLKFNRSFSLLRQKLAARSRIRVGPRILPESAGKKYESVAAIREGLIRNIERNSDCGSCDSIVSQNQLMAGIGAYEIEIDFANNDVFDTEIFIRPAFFPFSVTFDKLSIDPTGRDARHAMIESYLDIDDFKRAYPKASLSSIDEDTQTTWSQRNNRSSSINGWLTDKTVRVAKVWRMRERTRKLVQMDNGDVVHLPDGENPETFAIPDAMGGASFVMRDPSTGELVMRDSPELYAEGVITNGIEILKGPFEMSIDRVPLIRVPGWVVPLGDRIERFSLFSFAKDAMRFYNYIRSDIIERQIFRPRFAWTANEEEVQGREALWSNSHLARNAIGLHKGPSGGGPQPVLPPAVDQGAILQSQAAIQDILDIFDVRPAPVSQGATPPTASALDMLQNISDASNFVFDEAYFAAKREAYRIINQLIPKVYNTTRIIKVLGEDDQLKTAIINDPENPESADVTIGKYSVAVDVGPSLLTRRAQSAEFMKTMINSAPDAASIVFDKLIELQNIQGGDVLARRWRERFGIKDEEEAQSPEAQAAAQQQMALQQAQIDMQLRTAQADLDLKLAEIEVKRATAQAQLATVESEVAQAVERRAIAKANLDEAAARVLEIGARARLSEAKTEEIIDNMSNPQLQQETKR